MKKFFAGVMFAVCVMMYFVGCSPKEECILKNFVWEDEGVISVYKIHDDSYRMVEELLPKALENSMSGKVKECHVEMVIDKAALEGWLEEEDISVQL